MRTVLVRKDKIGDDNPPVDSRQRLVAAMLLPRNDGDFVGEGLAPPMLDERKRRNIIRV